MQLTKNFNLSEFAVSADHPHLASIITFSETDKIKLFYLCKLIMQPIRDWLVVPIKILSGKRTCELNNAVDGAFNSDHLFEFCSVACDFTLPFPEYSMERIFEEIKSGTPGANRHKNIKPFGQLIYYPKKNFIHVSLPTPKHHGEVFESE